MVSYLDKGRSTGIPVVLIHAFPFSHEMWMPQIEALEKDCRVVAYDIRGFGKSGFSDAQFTMELWVDDLIELLDHLKIQKAVVCGLSMGSYIALRAHERHPDRFRALVLADSRSEADGDEAKIKRADTIKAIKKDGLDKFADGFLKGAFHVPVDAARGIILKNQPLGVCGALLAMAARTDTTASLSKIQVPTLILVGEHDKLTPVASAEALHAKIKNSKLEVIAGAGHISNLEKPDVFNGHLKKFIASV